MSTYREITYLIADELKLIADDSFITNKHIIFLIDKYRAVFLKKYYKDIKTQIPESNYQTLCLPLTKINGVEGDPCSGSYLRSAEEIPNLLSVGTTRVTPESDFLGEITYVSRDRFKYIGFNKYLKNIIYVTIGADNKLYLKSTNPQAYYLESVKFTGIFEDASNAATLECKYKSDNTKICDILDLDCPVEESFIPLIVDSIVKELSGIQYRITDNKNDATDSTANKMLSSRNGFLYNGRGVPREEQQNTQE